MPPQTAIRNCIAKAATFKGRAPRAEFWWFMALNAAAGILALGIDGPIPSPGQESTTRWAHLTVTFAFLIPNVSVAARRLHDLGQTARWLLLVPSVIAAGLSIVIAGAMVPALAALTQVAILATNAMTSVAMLCLLVAFAFKGTKGPNRFGPDPLASPDFGIPSEYRYKP